MSMSKGATLLLLECFFCCSFELEAPVVVEALLAFFMTGLASSLHSPLVLVIILRPQRDPLFGYEQFSNCDVMMAKTALH